MPVITADAADARRGRRRARPPPVIHWLRPLASAVRPSSDGRHLDAQPGPAALDAREKADVDSRGRFV